MQLGLNTVLCFELKPIQIHFSTFLKNNWTKKFVSFTIGKSHARQIKKRGGGFATFDRFQPSSWRLHNEINSRWRNEYLNKGYNGLVALTAVTRHVVPEDFRNDMRCV